MSVTLPWVKHSVQLHTTDLVTAVLLGGLQRVELMTGTEILSDISDAELYPDHVSISRRRSGASFASTNVSRCLAALGFGAYCITADGSHPGVTFFFQKRACDGQASGSVHNKFVFSNGVIIPQQLSVSHRTPAVISYMLRGAGTGQPAKTANVALPTFGNESVERFDLYAAAVGGTALSQNVSITLDFNGTLFEEGADDDVDASFVGIQEAQPRLTFRNFALSSFGSIDLDGVVCTNANSSFVLKKRGVATTEDEHIQITFKGLGHVETIHSAQDRSLSEEVLVIDLARDNSNAPFVIDTAYQIA